MNWPLHVKHLFARRGFFFNRLLLEARAFGPESEKTQDFNFLNDLD